MTAETASRSVLFADISDSTRLYDELGERHDFLESDALGPNFERASYVPRSLIRGRAVLVVWPMVPSLGVYRLKWVR